MFPSTSPSRCMCTLCDFIVDTCDIQAEDLHTYGWVYKCVRSDGGEKKEKKLSRPLSHNKMIIMYKMFYFFAGGEAVVVHGGEKNIAKDFV